MSDEHAWDRTLGKVAREEAVDPRLEAWAKGELSELETAALFEEAQHNEDLQAALALFRPLSADEGQRLVRVVSSGTSAPPRVAEGSLRPPRSAQRLPARAARRWIAAAAMVLVVGGSAWWAMRSGYAINAYTIEVSGGDRALRSDPENSDSRERPRQMVLAQDSRLEVVLRPVEPETRGVRLSVFRKLDDRYEPLSIPHQLSDEGSFRIKGAVDQLLPGLTGEIELAFVIDAADAPAQPNHPTPGPLTGAQIFFQRLKVIAAD